MCLVSANSSHPDGDVLGPFSCASLVALDAWPQVKLEAVVYVECGNSPAVDEAIWALGLADDATSKVAAVVAHVKVQEGPEPVRALVSSVLKARGWDGEDELAAALARDVPRLRGGRVVLPGQIGALDDGQKRRYAAGVRELGKMNLHYEFCCQPGELGVSPCTQSVHSLRTLSHLFRTTCVQARQSLSRSFSLLSAPVLRVQYEYLYRGIPPPSHLPTFPSSRLPVFPPFRLTVLLSYCLTVFPKRAAGPCPNP